MLKKIKKLFFKEELKKNLEENLINQCSICLLEITDIYKIKCNHKFHKDCLLNWILIKNNCPLCRRDLTYIRKKEKSYFKMKIENKKREEIERVEQERIERERVEQERIRQIIIRQQILEQQRLERERIQREQELKQIEEIEREIRLGNKEKYNMIIKGNCYICRRVVLKNNWKKNPDGNRLYHKYCY